MRKVEPKKDDYMLGGSGPLKPAKSKPRYPVVSLPLDALPEAKDWEVVKEGEDSGPYYVIEMRVRMVSLSQGRYDQRAEFELRGIDASDDAEESKGEAGE